MICWRHPSAPCRRGEWQVPRSQLPLTRVAELPLVSGSLSALRLQVGLWSLGDRRAVDHGEGDGEGSRQALGAVRVWRGGLSFPGASERR